LGTFERFEKKIIKFLVLKIILFAMNPLIKDKTVIFIKNSSVIITKTEKADSMVSLLIFSSPNYQKD